MKLIEEAEIEEKEEKEYYNYDQNPPNEDLFYHLKKLKNQNKVKNIN